jgi:hypothetical protein
VSSGRLWKGLAIVDKKEAERLRECLVERFGTVQFEIAKELF